MIRVLIVDDQELVRDGFCLVLGAEPDIEVVGSAADGVEAVEMSRELQPDVVLMDIRMPRLDGIGATRAVLSERPQTRVLVLSTYDVDEYVVAALDAGASGYLLKDAPRRALSAAVRAAAEGDVLLHPQVARRLVAASTRRATLDSETQRGLERLTPREREVLTALARGWSNNEIAQALTLGETTVKTHVARLLQKLAVRDRVQLVVLAHTAGLADK